MPLIIKCTDPLMWYRHLVGQLVPLVRDLEAEGLWMSMEPAGFKNIVHKADAVRVPGGHRLVGHGELIERGDRLIHGAAWVLCSLPQWGQPVNQQHVIRAESEGPRYGIED